MVCQRVAPKRNAHGAELLRDGTQRLFCGADDDGQVMMEASTGGKDGCAKLQEQDDKPKPNKPYTTEGCLPG